MPPERQPGPGWLERLWYEPAGGAALRAGRTLLRPLAGLYALGRRHHRRGKPVDIGVPVISVGNLTVGGNGKTPLVIDLACRLGERGLRVAIVSRGYRRQGRGLLLAGGPGLPPAPPRQAGDEPALLVRRCPQAGVVVGADRVAAARLAVARFAPDLVLADDAFQHRRLGRRLDVVAIHARRGLGNGRLLPAGPLREPAEALARADAVVFTYSGGEPAATLAARHGIDGDGPLLACDFEPAGFSRGNELETCPAPAGVVFVFAAVAWPQGLLDSCRRAGLQVAGSRFRRDHHWWSRREIEGVLRSARRLGARACVCTEKDLVKLDGLAGDLPVLALRLRTRWSVDPLERLDLPGVD